MSRLPAISWDDGKTAIFPPLPYYDTRTRKWYGEEPPRRSPDNPKCENCGDNEYVEIHVHAHVDSDGYFHPASYQCLRCGSIW